MDAETDAHGNYYHSKNGKTPAPFGLSLITPSHGDESGGDGAARSVLNQDSVSSTGRWQCAVWRNFFSTSVWIRTKICN